MIRLTIFLLLSFPTVALAQQPTGEQQLALAVAKVCANEASLQRATPADCALIFQATRRHGDTALERLEWLRRHSNCVLTDRPMTANERKGNCRWSRHLTASAAEPDGWDPDLPWEDPYAGRWRAMRNFCLHLVRGGTPRGGWPCSRDPDTWGGRMDDPGTMASMECRGTANEGYRWSGLASNRLSGTAHVNQREGGPRG